MTELINKTFTYMIQTFSINFFTNVPIDLPGFTPAVFRYILTVLKVVCLDTELHVGLPISEKESRLNTVEQPFLSLQ